MNVWQQMAGGPQPPHQPVAASQPSDMLRRDSQHSVMSGGQQGSYQKGKSTSSTHHFPMGATLVQQQVAASAQHQAVLHQPGMMATAQGMQTLITQQGQLLPQVALAGVVPGSGVIVAQPGGGAIVVPAVHAVGAGPMTPVRKCSAVAGVAWGVAPGGVAVPIISQSPIGKPGLAPGSAAAAGGGASNNPANPNASCADTFRVVLVSNLPGCLASTP